MISLPQARADRRRGRGFLSLVDFVHRSPMKISPWYVRLAPTQGFLLSLCAKAFASAVTLLQDFLCLFTRLSSAYPPFAFVLCSSSPWSPILGGLGSLNRIICVTWRILIFPIWTMAAARILIEESVYLCLQLHTVWQLLVQTPMAACHRGLL